MRHTALKCFPLFVLATLLLPGCNVAPQPVAFENKASIRDAVHEFTAALKDADASRIQAAIVMPPDARTQKLAQSVVADTLNGRQVQQQLAQRFNHTDQRAFIVGTDAWIEQMDRAAEHGPMLQAGDRVRVGELGKDGSLYLRNINGAWKVELVPTLVAESGGRLTMADPIVEYRFNVTSAINEFMLERLNRDEFASAEQFENAKDAFWARYMTFAISGDDPKDKLLGTLPRLPTEQEILAIDR